MVEVIRGIESGDPAVLGRDDREIGVREDGKGDGVDDWT